MSNKYLPAVLLGVVVGLLIAPSKGSQTRRKITKAVNDLSDYIHDSLENAADEAEDLMDSGIESFENAEAVSGDTYKY